MGKDSSPPVRSGVEWAALAWCENEADGERYRAIAISPMVWQRSSRGAADRFST